MLLNNINIDERHNRPAVLSKVGLQAHFISDGQYVDPYQISSVTIFNKSLDLYPYSILNSQTQLIDTSSVSGSILMSFTSDYPETSNFKSGSQYSSGDDDIFKLSTGKYIVVLDGSKNSNQTGKINLDGMSTTIPNTVSNTGDYIHAWTVRMYQNSDLQVVINDFTLRKGGFTVLTEPIMIKSKNRLINSKVNLGSISDIKVATDIHVENTQINESVKNLFRDTVVTSGAFEIQKLNEAANLPARVTVSSFNETSSLVSITADNVLLFNWDTTKLSTHPQLVAGNFGSIQGVYAIRVRYTIFKDTIISDPMYLTLS